jgi:hypothetical protein
VQVPLGQLPEQQSLSPPHDAPFSSQPMTQVPPWQ